VVEVARLRRQRRTRTRGNKNGVNVISRFDWCTLPAFPIDEMPRFMISIASLHPMTRLSFWISARCKCRLSAPHRHATLRKGIVPPPFNNRSPCLTTVSYANVLFSADTLLVVMTPDTLSIVQANRPEAMNLQRSLRMTHQASISSNFQHVRHTYPQ
jgi:hypothetical protein